MTYKLIVWTFADHITVKQGTLKDCIAWLIEHAPELGDNIMKVEIVYFQGI